MTPQQEVDIVTEQEIAEAVRRALDTLGLTMDDLKKQAQTGRFQSERARLTWFAIRDIAA
jgi:hypothetical protein